jgi:hypothetical protein
MKWDDRVSWALLLLLSMLGARFVPSMAIDVPDEPCWISIDWPSRRGLPGIARPVGAGRIVIPEAAMRRLVENATRTVTASSAAIFLVTLLATPLLLASATSTWTGSAPGAWRSSRGRHPAGGSAVPPRSSSSAPARRGLACWLWLLAFEAGDLSPTWVIWGLVAVVVLGLVSVAAAVATGRGWRSVWWSRKAEVAESLTGAFAFASTVVASGLFVPCGK